MQSPHKDLTANLNTAAITFTTKECELNILGKLQDKVHKSNLHTWRPQKL
jgi:hypothetical protein